MSENQSMSLMDFVRAARAQIREVSPAELEEMIHDDKELLVIDVREPSEHEQGHIKNAMLVPRGILEAAADLEYPKHQPELSAARERPLAVYCATGGRSAMAVYNGVQERGESGWRHHALAAGKPTDGARG